MKSIFLNSWRSFAPKFAPICTLGFIAIMMPSNATAQNTGGVFPAAVNEGHKSVQYRSAYNDDTTFFNQRLHYQQAINGDFMWRIIGQTRETTDSNFDFDFIEAELFWELSDDDDKHDMGLRFDARLRDGDRANLLGLNWMNQFNFDDGWRARALLLTAVQVGENAADGLALKTRFQINKTLNNGLGLGLEMYNDYGTTDDGFGNFDDQNHTVGPYVNLPFSQGWSIFTGPLFGLSDNAPDTEYRLWLTKSL